MSVAGQVSWLYVIFGLLASALVSFLSFRFKLIEKRSELLYLSFGFYRHFLTVFFGNFISSMQIILQLAFPKRSLEPVICTINLSSNNHFNPALLATHCNLTAGLFCITIKKTKIIIHATHITYFEKLNLKKALRSLDNVNDDNII